MARQDLALFLQAMQGAGQTALQLRNQQMQEKQQEIQQRTGNIQTAQALIGLSNIKDIKARRAAATMILPQLGFDPESATAKSVVEMLGTGDQAFSKALTAAMAEMGLKAGSMEAIGQFAEQNPSGAMEIVSQLMQLQQRQVIADDKLEMQKLGLELRRQIAEMQAGVARDKIASQEGIASQRIAAQGARQAAKAGDCGAISTVMGDFEGVGADGSRTPLVVQSDRCGNTRLKDPVSGNTYGNDYFKTVQPVRPGAAAPGASGAPGASPAMPGGSPGAPTTPGTPAAPAAPMAPSGATPGGAPAAPSAAPGSPAAPSGSTNPYMSPSSAPGAPQAPAGPQSAMATPPGTNSAAAMFSPISPASAAEPSGAPSTSTPITIRRRTDKPTEYQSKTAVNMSEARSGDEAINTFVAKNPEYMAKSQRFDKAMAFGNPEARFADMGTAFGGAVGTILGGILGGATGHPIMGAMVGGTAGAGAGRGIGSYIGADAQSYASDEGQIFWSGASTLLAGMGYQQTGAATAEHEFARAAFAFIPNPGEPPELMAEKAKRRALAINAAEAGLRGTELLDRLNVPKYEELPQEIRDATERVIQLRSEDKKGGEGKTAKSAAQQIRRDVLEHGRKDSEAGSGKSVSLPVPPQAPMPAPATPAAPAGAPAGAQPSGPDVGQERLLAIDALRRGAPFDAVAKRFRERTGQDLFPQGQ